MKTWQITWIWSLAWNYGQELEREYKNPGSSWNVMGSWGGNEQVQNLSSGALRDKINGFSEIRTPMSNTFIDSRREDKVRHTQRRVGLVLTHGVKEAWWSGNLFVREIIRACF